MYMKSLVSLAVLGAMSAVATAGDLVVFDKPNESYTVDGLNKYGATIKASDITITNTTYNGIDAYGVFDLNAANDISIQGATNGIFTPSDHQNSSIKITTPKKLTITGPWAIHAEGKGTITIDAGDLVLRGSNGIAANSTGTVSIDAQTVDIASTNKYGVSSANTGGVTIKAEKSICPDQDGRQDHGRSPCQGRPGQSRHHLQQGRFDGFGWHQHAHSRHARSGGRKLAFAQPHSHERRAQAHGRSSFVQRQERRLGPL